MDLNKKQLAGRIAPKAKLKRAEVEKVIDVMIEEITSVLKQDGKVRLVGFGNFLMRSRAARAGRNPQTGEKISIPLTKSPGFVAGVNLKKALKS